MEFSTEMARNVLNSEIVEAEEILRNPSKVDDILIQLEDKLKAVPVIGNTLSDLPRWSRRGSRRIIQKSPRKSSPS